MTRRLSVVALFTAIVAIAVAYASAFTRGGAPMWAPWLLAMGIPIAIGAIMVLGAIRANQGIGRLAIPFALVVLMLAIGFGAALVIPGTEGPLSKLWFGLPARAAIVIYGVGLLPILVLPVAYALTFQTQILSAADVERVRSLAQQRAVGAAVDDFGQVRSPD
jgi:hypothetical protein